MRFEKSYKSFEEFEREETIPAYNWEGHLDDLAHDFYFDDFAALFPKRDEPLDEDE